MKKVLVFGMTENPGGVESVIMNYYRAMDRTQVQFDFLCNSQTVAYEEEIVSLGGRSIKFPPGGTDGGRSPRRWTTLWSDTPGNTAPSGSTCAVWPTLTI